VPGGVGDDELAPLGGEVAVGDVDGDALLALGLQAVDQQREVELAPGRAAARALAPDRGELVLVDTPRVVEQAPDQGALPVVDAPAGEEAEQLLLLLARQVAQDVALEQRLLALRARPPRAQK
jgi:hypothetical protein